MVERKIKNRVLAEKFGVSLQTIRNARKEITKTKLADEIREAAFELANIEVLQNDSGKKIKMTVHGRVGEMARLFGVSLVQVHRALTLEQHSITCKAIRKYALENGGIEY